MAAAEVSEQAHFRVHSAKSLVLVLQAIKPASNKQASVATITKDGIEIRWEDDSKSLQSSIFLNSELFAEFSVPWVRRTFGLHFHLLMDTLNVFASLPGNELSISYPGPGDEILLKLLDTSEDQQLCTYARINTLELELSAELSEYWQEPSSYFLASGTMLKEAIEDLEWGAASGAQSQAAVRLHLRRSPPQIALTASEIADMTIKLPVSDLAGFMCSEGEITHKYKYKLLRAAFSHLPSAKDFAIQMPTKVTIDSQGIMKVMHMVSLSGNGVSQGGSYQNTTNFSQSQAAARKGRVQFMLLPQDALIDYDPDD